MNMILHYALAAVLVISGVRLGTEAARSDEYYSIGINDEFNAGNKTEDPFSYKFVDDDDITLAIMELKKYPIQLNLKKKVMNKDQQWYWQDLGSTSLNDTPSSASATNSSGGNSTQQIITATLEFTDLKHNENDTLNVTLTDATLVITFEMGGPTNSFGYWNMSKATIDIKYLNGTVVGNSTTDITTPKFGYTDRTSDAACTSGYGVCAPLGLHWSCYDQLLAPALQAHPNNSLAIFVTLPGLALFPFAANRTVSDTYNWDCSPLLPISLWTSLLITLGLAAVVAWALAMLGALPTPDKWDDPKKPGIYIPQGE